MIKNFRTILMSVVATLAIPAASSHASSPLHAARAYQPTKKAWAKTYNRLVKNNNSVKGTTYIGPLEGNGYRDKLHRNKARDTIVFIPEATTLENPVDLIFYFHGLGGFKERDFNTRVLRHTPSIDPERNYVIIIAEMPWSKYTSTPRTRQGRVFTRKGSFPQFVNSVIHVVNLHFKPPCEDLEVGNVTLVGHSAGGSTLMSISRSGGLNWLYGGLGATSVKAIFSDASYGRWLDIAWKYCTRDVRFVVLTRKWDKPHRHTQRFLKKFKNVPDNIEHVVFDRKTTHAGIGDQTFRWVYLEDESGCGC